MPYSKDYLDHIQNMARGFKKNPKVPYGMRETVEKFIRAVGHLEVLKEDDIAYLYEVGQKLRQNLYHGTPSWGLANYNEGLNRVLKLQETSTNMGIAVSEVQTTPVVNAGSPNPVPASIPNKDLKPEAGVEDPIIFVCPLDNKEFEDFDALVAHTEKAHADIYSQFKELELQLGEAIQEASDRKCACETCEKKGSCNEAMVASSGMYRLLNRGSKCPMGKMTEQEQKRKRDGSCGGKRKFDGSGAGEGNSPEDDVEESIVMEFDNDDFVAAILEYCNIHPNAIDRLIREGQELDVNLPYPDTFYEKDDTWVDTFNEAYAKPLSEAGPAPGGSPGRGKMLRLMFGLGVLSKGPNGKLKYNKNAPDMLKLYKTVKNWGLKTEGRLKIRVKGGKNGLNEFFGKLKSLFKRKKKETGATGKSGKQGIKRFIDKGDKKTFER